MLKKFTMSTIFTIFMKLLPLLITIIGTNYLKHLHVKTLVDRTLVILTTKSNYKVSLCMRMCLEMFLE